jgi:hypothetical protein
LVFRKIPNIWEDIKFIDNSTKSHAKLTAALNASRETQSVSDINCRISANLDLPAFAGDLIEHTVDVLMRVFGPEHFTQFNAFIEHDTPRNMWAIPQFVGSYQQDTLLDRTNLCPTTINGRLYTGKQVIEPCSNFSRQFYEVINIDFDQLAIRHKLSDDLHGRSARYDPLIQGLNGATPGPNTSVVRASV